jgi:MoxR-like ATPase
MKVAVVDTNQNIAKEHLTLFFSESQKIIYGKEKELKLALTALLARGHLLIEDVPGMGKTTFVTCLSKLLGLKMSRIQFTNDLLPSDVLGSNIFDNRTGEFRFIPGPIFSEIVLGDELNRASPKAQSAFLQAMEERSVTLDGKTHALPELFFIIATQNPHTQVGTHPLPESQLDRFLMKLSLGYPDRAAETEMLKGGDPRMRLDTLKPVFDRLQLVSLLAAVNKVLTTSALIEYVQDLLVTGRSQGLNLSPRAGLLLLQAAKSWAFLDGRNHVLPEDVQDLAAHVLTHRQSQQNSNVIEELIRNVRVP